MEQWKDIKLDTRYQVSSYGRIRRGERILKGCNQNGYRAVDIGGKRLKIHRLVATAFLDMDYYGPRNIVVMHLDDDKTNNNVTNLKVGRQYENVSYRVKSGVQGVNKRSDGRWRASFKSYQSVHKTEQEAIIARENFLKI